MPRFDPTISLGNWLTILAFVLGALTLAFGQPGDVIRAQARITAAEVALANNKERQLQFQQDVRQDLIDIKAEIRELRSQIGGVRWRDLPPSPYARPQ